MKPRHTRELRNPYIGKRRIRRGFKPIYRKRRFQFYRAGFKTIRLPGVIGSAVFMAAYQIAYTCQLKFTPAAIDRKLATKISIHASILFQTPAFRRLRFDTQRTYWRLLDEFCQQIGGVRRDKLYDGATARIISEAASTSEIASRLRSLSDYLKVAIARPPHPGGYKPLPVIQNKLSPPSIVRLLQQKHKQSLQEARARAPKSLPTFSPRRCSDEPVLYELQCEQIKYYMRMLGYAA